VRGHGHRRPVFLWYLLASGGPRGVQPNFPLHKAEFITSAITALIGFLLVTSPSGLVRLVWWAREAALPKDPEAGKEP
jgi:hypothetical protein